MKRRLALAVLTASVTVTAAASAGPGFGFRFLYRSLLQRHDELVRRIWVPYQAWDGRQREALLVLPSWYGPRHDPPIPLVISPHGRGGTARGNARYWGSLPALGPFAVVNPQGQGRRLVAYSWGWRGQIRDLARMPHVLERALPWLRVDRSRIYAIGSSMGGQETLLLAARRPHLLAGAVALDSATDLAARYRAFPRLPGGGDLQAKARLEVGGTPASAPAAYAARSPMSFVRRLAHGGVPLFIWWSRRDRVVSDQNMESGRLYRAIKRINPQAPVYEYVGSWRHSAEMRPSTQLPLALVELRLIQLDGPLPLAARRAGPSMLDVPVDVPRRLDGRAPAGATLSMPAAFVHTLPWLRIRDVVGTVPSRLPAGKAATVPRWTSSTG